MDVVTLPHVTEARPPEPLLHTTPGCLGCELSLLRRRLSRLPLLWWRSKPAFGKVEAWLLALYTFLLAITLPFHEPWADEAQAWLIARDNSFWEIFHRRLHYEGSPPLWHFLLRTLHLLHVPWPAIGWCGAALATAGVFVWLRWSPLPPILRWLFPFSFFLQYQYAVVARSYILFPLLTFTLCILYRARKPRVVLFALIAGLLAALCMQGLVVSSVLSLLYCVELRKRWLRTPSTAPSLRGIYAAIALAACFWSASVYTAIPAPDVAFAVKDEVSSGWTHRVLLKLVAETPTNHPAPVPPDHTAEEWKIIWDTAVPPEPNVHTAPKAWLAREMRAPASRRSFGDGLNGVLYPLFELASELFWPIANSNLLACLFVLSIGVWAYWHRALRCFLPAVALLFVGEFIWMADHHSGMVLITLVAGIWLGAPGSTELPEPTSASEVSMFVAGALVLILQISWTLTTIHHDRIHAYDPSLETARFLQTQPSTKRMVAFHFWTVGIEAYFARSPFANLPSSWWQWCSHVLVDAAHRETLASRPDIVVYTFENPEPDGMRNQVIPLNHLTGYEPIDPILLDIQAQNYRETHRFCGRRYARWSAAYTVCNVIFEPNTPKARSVLQSPNSVLPRQLLGH